jgi:choline dehydrogenase-like flavoprotein
MAPISLDSVQVCEQLRADLIIVGGGACGLTLARSLAGSGLDIILLESGENGESPAHAVLNRVEMPDDCWRPNERVLRKRYHGEMAKDWLETDQPYGLRSRGLGGASKYWAGKCSPFDPIDYQKRNWVPNSGWPIDPLDLQPYLKKAEADLLLGDTCYDEALWSKLGIAPPNPPLMGDSFETCFWQFARSPRVSTEIFRFGEEAIIEPPQGVRIITDATVTKVLTNSDGGAVTGVNVKSLSGGETKVSAKACVLAATAIENARLLLASDDVHTNGLGNRNDQVGRYLIDHPMAIVARFSPDETDLLARRFGFFTAKENIRTHLYMHGLSLSSKRQHDEQMLNGAIYMSEERTPDDPVSALARLLRSQSEFPARDLNYLIRSPNRWMRSLGIRLVESGRLPGRVERFAVDTVLRLNPNTAVGDARYSAADRQIGMRVEAISEQEPDQDNRVTLSAQKDSLGLRLPNVRWRTGAAARTNLLRMAELFRDSFAETGLSAPKIEQWVEDRDFENVPAIDMGHSMGTTRMSHSPLNGVVDIDCKVHGVTGLWVSGGSVMPTGGHANPTLMMLALTQRLGSHLKQVLR